MTWAAGAVDLLHRRGQFFSGRGDFFGALGDVGRVLEFLGQLGQVLRRLFALGQRLSLLGDRLGRFLGRRRLFLSRRRDLFGALERLERGGARLLGAGGDILDAARDLDHVDPDLFELGVDGLAVLDFALDLLGRVVDAVRDGLDLALDLADQILDLLGALLGGLGQGAHLVGDDREALAVLAGARGLDGGVEREQIGLIGDAGDRLDDVADVGGLLFEFGDHLDRIGLTLGGHTDIADESGDIVTDLEDERLRHLDLGLRILGTVELAPERDIDLLEGGERFLRRARGLLGAGGDLIGRAFQFLGGGSRFVDAGGQLRRRRGDALGGLLLLGERARPLALGLGLARSGRAGACLAGRGGGRTGGLFHECHGNVLRW
jgi:hypothetical protein